MEKKKPKPQTLLKRDLTDCITTYKEDPFYDFKSRVITLFATRFSISEAMAFVMIKKLYGHDAIYLSNILTKLITSKEVNLSDSTLSYLKSAIEEEREAKYKTRPEFRNKHHKLK